jgi:hypothetical protein
MALTWWSRFWDWILRILGKGESREDEENKDEKDAEEEIVLTEEEKKDEKKGTKTEAKLVKELKNIRKELSKQELAVEIREGKGKTAISIERALWVLTINIIKLVHTGTSIKAEEQTLQNIVDYWSVLRQGLRDQQVQKDVSKVDVLFEELEIILKDEDKIGWKKIQLVQQQYDLITKETGGKTKQKTRQKVTA